MNYILTFIGGSSDSISCRMTAIWTFVIAIFTVVVGFVAVIQLIKLSKTSSADFLIKFKNDFFIKENHELFELIFDNKLKIVEKSNEKKTTEEVTAYIIDDFVGHFDDLGLLEQHGIIDIEMIYEMFSLYIEKSWENCAIQDYIQEQRKIETEDLFDKFEYIYNECKSFGHAKLHNQNLRIWKLKRRLCKFCVK